MLLLAGFTVWITREAKSLEQDLQTSSQKIALLDQRAPDFRITALDGRTVSLSDYVGRKKLVLLFWASWNNASHPQMMTLSSMYQASHKADSDFDILAVSVDDDAAAARRFATESKIPFPVALDPKRTVTDAYRITTVPTVLLIDADGKVALGTVGFGQRGQGNELARRLGVRPGEFRMEMRGPNGGRGN